MVSTTSILAAFVVATTAAAASPELQVGDYYRPEGEGVVSGFPNATTPYVRSPCPAINSLANHGYINRDGRNVSRAELIDAMVEHYNLDRVLATFLASPFQYPVDLSTISTHNIVEHDASLVHADVSSGQDPVTVDMDLWREFLGHAKDGRFGFDEMVAARKSVTAHCMKKQPPAFCDLAGNASIAAAGEVGLTLLSFGGKQNESISVEHVESFFFHERFPADYKKPATPVTRMDIGGIAARLFKALSKH